MSLCRCTSPHSLSNFPPPSLPYKKYREFTMMVLMWRLLAYLSLLLFVGCSANEKAKLKGLLLDKKKLWENQNLHNYQVVLSINCNCNRLMVAAKEITVKAGRVTSVRLVEHKELKFDEIKMRQDLQEFEIDSLFSKLEKMLSSSFSGKLELDFDPRYDFPIRIFIDPQPVSVIDDEMEIRLSDFKPISVP